MVLYLLYRGLRDGRYFRGIPERLGFTGSVDSTPGGGIWFHAVSVGEVLSSLALIRRLLEDHPGMAVYVSVSTLAGRAVADEKLRGLAAGVFYTPLDYRSAVRRVLRRLRPRLMVVMETEIWPNLYREAKRAGASLVVVNGRISDRAFPRYRRFQWFFRHTLMQPDAIFVQTEEDARRYIAAGAPPEIVRVGGNLKYDFAPPALAAVKEVGEFLDRVAPEAIWIAASTMPPAAAGDIDEDDCVLDAFGGVAANHNDLLLILAPRRPERFDSAAAKIESRGIAFVRRSQLSSEPALRLPGVLVLDSIGELAPLFERASVVFMGGTLARRGGHNILEPAHFGKPVIVGPHMENFAEIASEFRADGAAEQIEDANQLAGAVLRLLEDSDRSARLGEAARRLAAAKRGVTERIALEVVKAAEEGLPLPMRTLPARLILTPASWIWRAGNTINQTRNRRHRRTLSRPVISIGGLAMGGSGKTPMVARLAERLHTAERNPAVLTRGYGRKESSDVVIVRRGEQAPIEVTGDEAQILVRRGKAHLGIGANRFETGRRLEEELAPGVFLLDDGFQHTQLARTNDIVLIDANEAPGAVFPLGRLREPLSALARATIFILTRVEAGFSTGAIETLLRRYNPRAPIFASRVVARGWVDETGAEHDVSAPPFARVGAFCGLGSPGSFWRTLAKLGVPTVFRREFPDHHRYTSPELQKMAREASAAGADALVTTEKDMMNLCELGGQIAAPLKLYWLRIDTEVEGEDELIRLIS